jgi:hypothetical protein
MSITLGPPSEAYRLWRKVRYFRLPPRPVLGKPDSAGAHLIRRGKDLYSAEATDFGVYLGTSYSRHVVGVKDEADDPGSWERSFSATEFYDTLEELTATWQLD